MEDTRVVEPVMGATNPFVKPVTRVTKPVTRVTKPSKGRTEGERSGRENKCVCEREREQVCV